MAMLFALTSFAAEPLTMVGTVKRAVQNGDAVIVLTHEADGTAHIYNVVDGVAVAELSQEGVVPVDPENKGSYLAISDIAVTEDGKLVANNYIRCSFNDNVVESGYKRGTLTFYIWDDLAAAPTVWFQSKASSNSNNSDQGYTMAVVGTSTNANILVSGVHNAQRGVRMSHFSIVDGVFEDTQDGSKNLPYYYYIGNNFKSPSAGDAAAVFNEQTHGVNIQFNASPLTNENWIIDGELTNPIEFINPQTHAGEVVINATLNEDLGKKYNGATYVAVGEKVLMVAPFATPAGVLVGIEILDITNGLGAAQYVNILYLEKSVAPTAAATAVQVVEGEEAASLLITLVADATIYNLETEVATASNQYTDLVMSNLKVTNDDPFVVLKASDNMTGISVELLVDIMWGNLLVDQSAIYWNGTELTIVEASAVTVEWSDKLSADVYNVQVVVDFMGSPMGFNLIMYGNGNAMTIEMTIEDAVADIHESTEELYLSATWEGYPVKVYLSEYYADEEYYEYEGMQISELEIGNDDWNDYAIADAVVVTKEGNTLVLEGDYFSHNTGNTYAVTISANLTSTGLENTTVIVNSVKTMKNGQLIIRNNGLEYNVQGAVLK